MKKRTPTGVLAKLCLYFLGSESGFCHKRCQNPPEQRDFQIALSLFFSDNHPEIARYITLMIRQCWMLNDCRLKAEVSDKDVALFLLQLNELVEAAYLYNKSCCECSENYNRRQMA